VENLTTNDRIKHLISFKQLSISSFSREIGLINGVTISKIINEKRKPSSKTIGRIIKAFPDINYDWLITGQGDMLKGKINNSTTIQNQDDLTVTAKQVIDFMIDRYDNGIADKVQVAIDKNNDDLEIFLNKGKNEILKILNDHTDSLMNKLKYYDKKVEQMESAYSIGMKKINTLSNTVKHIDESITEIETYNLVEEVRKLKEINENK